MNKRKSLLQGLPAALLCLSAAVSIFGAAISIYAQSPDGAKHNARPQQAVPAPAVRSNSTDAVKYSYEFSQPKFYVKHIVIQHDANGRGTVTFERLNEDVPVTEPLELSPDALARISTAWQGLRFLDSETNYQADKQFPHLGTMKISMERGDRKRVAEFNWTNNRDAETLINEYRKAADQVILVFDHDMFDVKLRLRKLIRVFGSGHLVVAGYSRRRDSLLRPRIMLTANGTLRVNGNRRA